MRLLGLALLCLAACHGDDHPARKIVAIQEPEETPDASPDASGQAAEAGRRAALRDVDAGAARHTKIGGALLLCETHQAWTPAAGFIASAIGTTVVARLDDELVGVAYPAHADTSFASAVAPFVEGTLAWDNPAMKRIGDGQAEATTHGRGTGLVVAATTLYAGVDTSGKGRAGRDLSHGTADVVWFAIAPTEKAADDRLAATRAATLMLVDHACECGYDCLPKR